jgi:hypothetical protein
VNEEVQDTQKNNAKKRDELHLPKANPDNWMRPNSLVAASDSDTSGVPVRLDSASIRATRGWKLE